VFSTLIVGIGRQAVLRANDGFSLRRWDAHDAMFRRELAFTNSSRMLTPGPLKPKSGHSLFRDRTAEVVR